MREGGALSQDIDIKVADLSVTGVLRFAQWSQGSRSLISALECFAELFNAAHCLMVRVDPDEMSSEYVGEASAAGVGETTGETESYAARVLASDIRRLVEGDVKFLSRMNQLPFRLAGGVDRRLSDRRIEDLAFICLEVGTRGVVLVEMQYTDRPSIGRRGIVEWIAPKLLRAYRPGNGIRVDEDIARSTENAASRLGGDCEENETLILSSNNPSGLTRSEWRVCQLASRGLAAKSIAYELGVSGNTVRTHLRNVYSKTDVTCYHELVYRLISQSSKVSYVDEGEFKTG